MTQEHEIHPTYIDRGLNSFCLPPDVETNNWLKGLDKIAENQRDTPAGLAAKAIAAIERQNHQIR